MVFNRRRRKLARQAAAGPEEEKIEEDADMSLNGIHSGGVASLVGKEGVSLDGQSLILPEDGGVLPPIHYSPAMAPSEAPSLDEGAADKQNHVDAAEAAATPQVILPIVDPPVLNLSRTFLAMTPRSPVRIEEIDHNDSRTVSSLNTSLWSTPPRTAAAAGQTSGPSSGDDAPFRIVGASYREPKHDDFLFGPTNSLPDQTAAATGSGIGSRTVDYSAAAHLAKQAIRDDDEYRKKQFGLPICCPACLMKAPAWLKVLFILSVALIAAACVLIVFEQTSSSDQRARASEVTTTTATTSTRTGGTPTTTDSDSSFLVPSRTPTSQPVEASSDFTEAPGTLSPTLIPSASSSSFPTLSPTPVPSPMPTQLPTPAPSPFPTTASPTKEPTRPPTLPPTPVPTEMPTTQPSASPTKDPSRSPTLPPTTQSPVVVESKIPSQTPSVSVVRTGNPSQIPVRITSVPSIVPIAGTTLAPSTETTSVPTSSLPVATPEEIPSSSPTFLETTSAPTFLVTSAPVGSAETTASPTTTTTQEPVTVAPTPVPPHKVMFYAMAGRESSILTASASNGLPLLPTNDDTSFLIHLGGFHDPQDTSCALSTYQGFADTMRTSSVPVFLVPGEEDWTACPNPVEAFYFWESTLVGLEQSVPSWPTPFGNVRRMNVMPENFAISFLDDQYLLVGINLVGGEMTVDNEDDFADRERNNLSWIQRLYEQLNSDATMIVMAHAGPDVAVIAPFYAQLEALIQNVYADNLEQFILLHQSSDEALATSNTRFGVEENYTGKPNSRRIYVDADRWPPMQITLQEGVDPVFADLEYAT